MLTNEQKEQIDKMGLYGRWDLAESVNNVDILRKLSNDEDSNVRYKVAENVNTPIGTLVKLSRDKHRSVRNKAIEQIKERKNINVDKYTTKGILE